MAAPHVAGLAALLWQAQPSLTVEQIVGLLTATTRPLDEDAPNNNSGWGLIDAYAAGLQVTASGELAGRVNRTDAAGIAGARLAVMAHESNRSEVYALTDAMGAFTVALRPGLYDLSAVAFGYERGSHAGIAVSAGRRTPITLTLTALPAGAIFGRITDDRTGAPISATVVVEDAPISARSDPQTGLYSLALPAGDWSLRIAAHAHRLGRQRVTVAAGDGQQIDIALPPGPRILLVDSGRWYYGSQINYFTAALEALDYPIDPGPSSTPGKMPVCRASGHRSRRCERMTSSSGRRRSILPDWLAPATISARSSEEADGCGSAARMWPTSMRPDQASTHPCAISGMTSVSTGRPKATWLSSTVG